MFFSLAYAQKQSTLLRLFCLPALDHKKIWKRKNVNDKENRPYKVNDKKDKLKMTNFVLKEG